jgi:hypothetical protein
MAIDISVGARPGESIAGTVESVLNDTKWGPKDPLMAVRAPCVYPCGDCEGRAPSDHLREPRLTEGQSLVPHGGPDFFEGGVLRAWGGHQTAAGMPRNGPGFRVRLLTEPVLPAPP